MKTRVTFRKLEKMPELQEMSIIKNRKDLKIFLMKLRQDWYSLDDLKKEINLLKELTIWLRSTNSEYFTFFAVLDEPSAHRKNDGLGSYCLFKCVIIRSVDCKTHLMKTLIKRFWY